VSLHLSHRGYAVRLVAEGREVSTSSAVDGGLSGDPSGLLLDALAVAEPTRSGGIHTLTAAVRHASDGLLVVVLGALSVDEADQLARARHGMGTTVAVALDVATWDADPSRRVGAESAAAWSLLRAAGWAVVPLARDDSLADVWSHVAFGGALPVTEVPA
jgi:hypothetical protein